MPTFSARVDAANVLENQVLTVVAKMPTADTTCD
jgi:hypothetical protein